MREPRAPPARAHNSKNIMADPSQDGGYEAVSEQHLQPACIFEELKWLRGHKQGLEEH